MASDIGVVADIRKILDELYGKVFRIDSSIVALAETLHKNGYRLAILSNAGKDFMKFFNDNMPDIFDVKVFSCNEGLRKPDKKIFSVLLTRIGTQPGETAFIDDREKNIKVSMELGIVSILYEGREKLVESIKSLGVKVA